MSEKPETKQSYSGKRYISRAAACEKAGGISLATLHRHINAGRLPKPVKLGHRSLMPEAELEEALEKQR